MSKSLNKKSQVNHDDWLANLTEYTCPRCNKITIFADLCVECDKLLSYREDRIEAIEELSDINKEIEELKVRRKQVKSTIKETTAWLKDNDEEIEYA